LPLRCLPGACALPQARAEKERLLAEQEDGADGGPRSLVFRFVSGITRRFLVATASTD
jgi:hypothetical protein